MHHKQGFNKIGAVVPWLLSTMGQIQTLCKREHSMNFCGIASTYTKPKYDDPRGLKIRTLFITPVSG